MNLIREQRIGTPDLTLSAWTRASSLLSELMVYSVHRGSHGKTHFSYSFHFNEMARPAGLEPAPFCVEAAETILPNLARGSATGLLSASWGNSPQPTFSFTFLRFSSLLLLLSATCVTFP